MGTQKLCFQGDNTYCENETYNEVIGEGGEKRKLKNVNGERVE